MAIYGAVAYRANKLRMVDGKLVITSPSFDHYEWPAVPVTWAECSSCPKDEDEHINSQASCTCGIYSATNLKTISFYMGGNNYVPILVEALGNYWMHISNSDPEIKGLTSAGVQVIGVISDYRPEHRYIETPEMWLNILSSFYNVPLITVKKAQTLIDWAWDRFYEDKEVSYDTSEHYPIRSEGLWGEAHSG